MSTKSGEDPLPLFDPWLPRGQWLGVHQSPGRSPAGEAPHRVHQVSPAPFERQRPGGDQERRRRTQVLRLQPHPAAFCDANQRLLCRAPQPLPQLSPALLVCRGHHGCQGQGKETLPPTAGDDAPGETGLAARSRRLSQTRYYPGQTPRRGHTTTDNDAAQQLNEARRRLFQSIHHRSKCAA